MLILPENLVFLPLDQYLMTYGYISERIRLSRPVIEEPPIFPPIRMRLRCQWMSICVSFDTAYS
jgi:hypothetical protein